TPACASQKIRRGEPALHSDDHRREMYRDAQREHRRARALREPQPGFAPGAQRRTPTLAASLNSAAALPPKAGAQFAPWGGPAALISLPAAPPAQSDVS